MLSYLCLHLCNLSIVVLNRGRVFKSLSCLRSYALGVPFRYGLAAALFALAAVLFADWDRSRGVGGRRSPLMDTVQPVSFLCSVDVKGYSML